MWSEKEQLLYISCWNNSVFYNKVDDKPTSWTKLDPNGTITMYGILDSDQYIMSIANNGMIYAKRVNSVDNTMHMLYHNDGYVIVEGGFVKVWCSDLNEYIYCIVYGDGSITYFVLTLPDEDHGVAATPKMVVDYVGRQLTVVNNTIHPKLVTVPANFASTVTIPVKSGTIFKTIIGVDKLVLIDAPDYEYYEFTLFLVNAGKFNVTFQDNVVFSNGFTPIFTSSGIDILKFLTIDGGETWYCKQDGQHVH